MYFGNSGRRNKHHLRIIILLLHNILSFPFLDGNQYFIQTSKIANFTNTIENQHFENLCFIFHNMYFSIQMQLSNLEVQVQPEM